MLKNQFIKQARRLSLARQEKADKALIVAAGTGDVRAVDRLLRIGADVNAQEISYPVGEEMIETPLSAACSNGHADVVRRLLAVDGINVEEGWGDGWTPFIVVGENGHASIVPLLKAAGANVDARENYFSHTALMKAASLGHVETVQALIDAGADRTLKDRVGLRADEMICHQVVASSDGREKNCKDIAGIFVAADRRDAEAAATARALARAIENMPVLQRDIAFSKPLRLKRPER